MSARLHRHEPLRKETRGYAIVEGARVEPARWRRLLERIRWTVFECHYQIMELFVGSGTFVSGVILLLPMQTFPTSSAFGPLQVIAGENAWGAFTLLLAALSLAAFVRESFALRLGALMLHVLWYIFVGVLFTIGNPAGLGPFFVLAGLFSAWAFCRLAVQWHVLAGARLIAVTTWALELWERAERGASRTRVRVGLRTLHLRRVRRRSP